MEHKVNVIRGLFFCLIFWCCFYKSINAVPPVCSTLGALCQNTVDCCRGCCEGYSCVDRPYSCSGDLVPIPGSNSCVKYFCAPGEFCFLAQVCPPENPCPPQPFCRRDPTSGGANVTYYPARNSVTTTRPLLSVAIFAVTVLLFWQGSFQR